MEPVFSSLTQRQAMTLLAALTYGGGDALEVLDHLSESEAVLLRERAEQLLAVPREQRIAILAKELKRRVSDAKRQLAFVEPKLLAYLLKDERPALIEVVLRGLPSSLADEVKGLLPRRPVRLEREVNPSVLGLIRFKLEELIERHRETVLPGYEFADLLEVQTGELNLICDRMGARVLATALAGLPASSREALLRLMPTETRGLATRAAAAGARRALNPQDARALLELHGLGRNPAGLLRSAGLQRLARACLAESDGFAERMVARHNLGKVFVAWVREERGRPAGRADASRADFVEQLERLSLKGAVSLAPRVHAPKEPVGAAGRVTRGSDPIAERARRLAGASSARPFGPSSTEVPRAAGADRSAPDADPSRGEDA